MAVGDARSVGSRSSGVVCVCVWGGGGGYFSLPVPYPVKVFLEWEQHFVIILEQVGHLGWLIPHI